MHVDQFLFPKHIYPEYWFYWDRSQFRGSDVCEFYVGELYRTKMTWWNPGAEYLREEALYPFYGAINQAIPEFDCNGENRLSGLQLHLLLEELRVVEGKIRSAANVTELTGRLEVWVDESDFGRKKQLLLVMVDDFRNLCALALRNRTPLWILGT